jgi:two-component system phosphate regulon sensor histidine kinase PhoR
VQSRNHRLEEIRRVATAAGIGVVLGLAFGHMAWFVAGSLAAYLGWVIAELIKLYRWLNESMARGEPVEPPDSFGLWGEIFDGIHRLQKRERATRQEQQSIIDRARDSVVALRDAVIVLHEDGTLEWWNPAAERLLGLHWPRDMAQQITNLVRDPRLRGYLDAADFSQVLELTSPLSDDLHLQVQVTIFGNGDRLMIARDVTRIHQLEQMRRDFVANVSHELKTPLTVIKGYLENLVHGNGDTPPKHLRAFRQMAEQAERMDRLVNDLLLLSRLESTQPDPVRTGVHLKTMLENMHNDVATAMRDKGHTFSLRVDDDVRLLGSDIELQSAFSNILVNAAKYSEPNGDIDIHWWVDNRGAHLSIKDSGIGIEPQHIPRLTERFYRTDKGRSVAEGGTGLGLAIVKHVLKRHDASLEIHSEPGKGSTFICHFPRERVIR